MQSLRLIAPTRIAPTFASAFSLVCALAFSNAALAQATAQPATPQPPAATQGKAGDIKPDASADPNYANQTNAERNKVQPGNNAPIWRQVRSGQAGYASLPGPEAGVLIQSSGEWWREIRNKRITVYGGCAILVIVALITLFYFLRGTIKQDEPNSGRTIERFTSFERSMHWTMAICFSALAISGVVMLFGKYLLLPIIGSSLFGWLTYALKNIHNFVGPVFAISLVVVFVKWVRDNLPRSGDMKWLLKGGGLMSGEHIASHRFNAGEKVWFWLGVFALGIVVTASGFVLNKLVPGMVYTRGDMQVSHIIHAAAAIAMLCFAFGHIYIGTLGTEGAYKGMRTGYVDEAWAKQHHEDWYQDIKAGKIPAIRTPNTTPHSPTAQAVQV